MCDNQYFDEDTFKFECWEQPICDACWKQKRLEFSEWLSAYAKRCFEASTYCKKPPVPVQRPVETGVRHEVVYGNLLRQAFPNASSYYELTLTVDKDEPQILFDGLNTFVKSAMFDVIGWMACVELTKTGLPHIHAFIVSSRKYLDASKVKKVYAYRAELKRVRMVDNYINYLLKNKNDVSTIAYCKEKGIPQFISCQSVEKFHENFLLQDAKN